MTMEKQTNENLDKSNEPVSQKDNHYIGREEYLLNLEVKIAELKDLCQNLDPYSPLSEKAKSKLLGHGINEFDNPFTITNKLLLLLEDSISEQLKLRLKN